MMYRDLNKLALIFTNKSEIRTTNCNSGFVTLSVGICLAVSPSFLEVWNAAIVN